ncbi:MAG: DUF5126 domain-containing protein [Dysgonamonadaceae bacterium]|nr:DUF5126 domain-containing protein [Dysgonamonadaceae bacterium]
MKKIELTGIVLFCFFVLSQCEEEKNQPIVSGGDAPGLVYNIKETPLAGGAEISYSLPDDKNLLYVEAELTTPEGKTLNFKSSSYVSSIIISGLASTNPIDVWLFSVSKNGVRSQAQSFRIHPLDPPFEEVFRSVILSAMFGGVKLEFHNRAGAELALLLGYIEEDGTFTDYDGYYTRNAADSMYIFRGLPAEEKRFGIYVRDRWDNFSDTMFVNLTPLFEEEIDKSKWQAVYLDNDGPFYPVGHMYYLINRIENLWDGAWSKSFSDPYMLQLPSAYLQFGFFENGSTNPKSLTFDMGDTYRISRIRVNHYRRYEYMAARKWEVWGCSTTPPQDGDWDWPGWVKLAYMEQIKPSGLPGISYGEGDAEAWEAGTSGDVEVEDAVRYIRVRALESWATEPLMNCAEITLFGQKKN